MGTEDRYRQLPTGPCLAANPAVQKERQSMRKKAPTEREVRRQGKEWGRDNTGTNSPAMWEEGQWLPTINKGCGSTRLTNSTGAFKTCLHSR